MKRTVAVLVSILWLTGIVGVPTMFFVPAVQNILPEPVRRVTQDPLTLLDQLDFLRDLIPPEMFALLEGVVPDAGAPAMTATATPVPESDTVAAQPTDTPIPPTNTPVPEPPTDTPTPVSPEPSPTPVPDDGPVAIPVAVISQADLRAGPDATADVVGLVAAGGTVTVTGKDPTGLWYRLDDGTWISVDALAVAPPVPVVQPDAEQPAQEPAEQPAATEEPTAVPVVPPVVETTGVKAIVNADANLRSGPGVEFDRVDGVNFGQEVTVVGKSEDGQWYRLDSGNWLFAALIDEQIDVPVVDATGAPIVEPPPPAPGQPTVNTLANLRAGPGVEFDVIGSAEPGQLLTLEAQNPTGEWFKLDDGSWIFAVLVDNPPADLPVENPPAAEETGTEAPGTDETATGEQTAPAEEAPAAETPAEEAGGEQTTEAPAEETTPAEETAPATPATANVDANLRAGPGTEFDIVGSVTTGTELSILGQSADGEWLKLENDAWIAATLVDNAPTDLPVVEG